MRKHWYRNRKARHRRRQKECEKEPYGKYGILRGRRGKTHAAALPERAGSRCDRHGPVRAGCSEEVLKAAEGMNPKRIVYVSCNTATFARDAKILKSEGYEIKEVQPVDMFPQTMHVETVALLCRKDIDNHIEVKLELDEEDITKVESKGTYENIKDYILDKYGLKVSMLYIAQIKRKCGLELGENYNKSKKDNQVVPECPKEKEDAIMDTLKAFGIIVQEG